MEALESILTDLQKKYTDPNVNKQPNPELKSEQSQDFPSLDIEVKSASANPSSLNRLLEDLRNCANRATSEIEIQQLPSSSDAVNHDLQQVEAHQKAKVHQIYEQKAREWLKMLDPISGEGLWFAEFAKNYPSKLEAAIALIELK
ncbi:MAG: salt stress protein, Slr1339 family [Pseudanabaena sp.]